MVDIYRHSRMGKAYQVVLTGTLRCPLTAIFFMDLTTTKRCLLTFSIKFTKKKNFFFHTYMVFVGCTWHPWIPPHTFVKSHFMYLTSTKRCLLTFSIQFTERKTNPYIHGFCWEHMTHHWIPTHTFVTTHLWACSKSFQN